MIVNANMMIGIKSYSGKIRFGEKDFEFIMDAANVNLLTGKICYNDIKSVEYCNIMCFFPTGLRITLIDGTVKVFAVINRKKIKDYITNKLDMQ